MSRDCATPQAQFVLRKKVSMMWFRYGHFENRPGDIFDPNHLMGMEECSHVDSPSTSRKISFAVSSAVAGMSEKKTQRRIDSLRFFKPPQAPPMTVKEETGDGLTETTEETPTTRQQKETNIEPQLSRRPPTGLEERNSHRQILGLGFLHTNRGPFVSPGDSLESRSQSSEASRLQGTIAGGGCIRPYTLKTKIMLYATPVQERTLHTS